MHVNHSCISYDWIDPSMRSSIKPPTAYAVGGLIVQRDDLGVEHPIAFFSSKLTPAQRNWATIEREAVNKFKHWFFGSKVTIHSDHNPLTYLTESAPISSKLMRWSLALAEFNIEFKYKTGKLKLPADTLFGRCQER